MATTNANIQVGVKGLEQLNQLQSKLQQTSSLFGQLKSAIAGIAITSFITNAVKAAAALDDVASSTGIALEKVIGFSKAIKQFGGDFEGANIGIARFANYLDSAVGGNKKAQDSFLELGISLEDLRTRSEADLLRKTIKGLDELGKGSRQTALGMEIFGKKFATIEYDKVNANIDAFIEKSRKQADAVRAAADAEEQFGVAMSALNGAIVQAIKPLSDFIASMDPDTLERFASAIVKLTTVILGLTVISKVVAIAKEMSMAMTAMAAGTAVATSGIGTMLASIFSLNSGIELAKTGAYLVSSAFAGFGNSLKVASGGFALFRTSLLALGSGLLRFIPIIGQIASIFMILNEAVALITGSSVVEWAEKAAKALGFIKETRKDVADAKLEQQRLNEQKAEEVKRSRDVQDALAKEKEQLKAIVVAYQRSNEEANKKFALDTKSLTLSEEQKLLQEEQLSAYTKYAAEFNKLQDQINEKKVSGSASDKAMIPQIVAAQSKLTDEYNRQKDAINGLVSERVKETQAKQLELFQTKEMIDAQNKLQTIQDDIAKSTLPEIQKKYYDIDAAARASAKAAIEAEETRRNAKMPIEEQKKYYDAAIKGTESLKKATEEQYKQSRLFSTGWQQAFNDYVDNATNAAEQAKKIFQTMTQAMEDLLFNFFKTGKFGWRDFLQTVIDTLMRSQIQQLVAKTFGGIGSIGSGGGGGGLLGGAIIPGILAGGGPAAMGTPYIVGERGPELFVPASNGTMVPNSGLGGQTVVNYNISAVDAQSFKQMLARDPSFLYAVTEQGRRTLPGAA